MIVTQILAGEAEIEPDRGVTCRGAFEQGRGGGVLAVLPGQSSQPCRGLGVVWNDIQNGLPCLARLRPKARLVQRSRLLDKYFALRRHRDQPIQMRERAAKILCRAGDARREQKCCGIVRPLCQAGLDVAARQLDLASGKQHGGQQMIEDGIAGRAGETLFTELARLVRPAGIEGGGGATNNVLGGVLVHGLHIRTKERVRKEGRSRTLAKKAGSDPGRFVPSFRGDAERRTRNPEMISARFRVRANARPGMTTWRTSVPYCAASSASPSAG